MPTIAGIRRRGVTPEGIRAFAETVGVARKDARTELASYEHAVRNDLNMRVPRVLCVVKPLKVVITNYPEEQVDELDAPYYPHDVPKDGSRITPLLARAVDRSRRLHGGSAEEVFPARSGT
jgi:glutaminyl-tRNA synthetase